MFTKRIALAATIATVALAGCGSSSDSTSSTASSGTAAAAAPSGTTPTGTTPGGGPQASQVTGTAATKAGEAATAKYPGTVQGVMNARTGDGYTVMVTTDDGMKMVAVSADYEVTGLETMPAGGPGGGGGTPPSGTTPTGTPPSTTPSSASSSSTATATAA